MLSITWASLLSLMFSAHLMHASVIPKGQIKTSGSPKPWPGGVIPFQADTSYSAAAKSMMAKVMKMYADNTCIRWIPRTNEKNYVKILNSGGCCFTSDLGYPDYGTGVSTVSLEGGTWEAGMFHELMHVTGFTHEQNRVDRDKTIFVNYDNVKKGEEWAFTLSNPPDVWQGLNVPYDTQSVMQYGNDINNPSKKVYNTFDGSSIQKPDSVRPVATGLDLLSLNRFYKCDPNDCFNSPDCNNGQGPFDWQVSNLGKFVYAVNCDFRGLDIDQSSATSHEICRELCLANLNCSHVTWNVATQMCYMKKAPKFYPLSIQVVPFKGAVCGFVNTRY